MRGGAAGRGLERGRSDDRGDYLWVEYTRLTERKVASAEDDTGAAGEPEPERTAKNSVFKSAGKGEDLLAKMSPLAAQRSLDIQRIGRHLLREPL